MTTRKACGYPTRKKEHKLEEILVETVTFKEGAKDGRPWKRFGIKDANGNWYSTFNEQMAARCVEGQRVAVDYTSKMVNGRVLRDLSVVEEIADSNGSFPEAYSKQLPDGGVKWDKKDLEIARQAIWKSYLEGLTPTLFAQIVSHNAKVDADQRRDPIDYLLVTGARIVVAAERDIFERAPGEDAIPFEDGP